MDTSAELYDEEIIVDREGSYCQTLTIRYERPSGTQTRTSTACIDVTVIPTPPELFGRVEVTVGEQTVSSEWNGGTEDPAILDVTLHEGEEADVQFNHFMKGVDGNTARAKFTIEDTYYIGKRYSNYFEYDSADSGTEVNVYTNTIDGIAKTMTVCETLTYTYYNETKSAEACARITLLRPSRVIRTPDDDVSTIRFSAQIDPYIQLKTGSNGLITSGNVAELLQTGTTIDIITNNISGYTATITSNRNSTDEYPTSLYNRYAKMYIPTLEGSVLKSEFPTNYWGFSFEDENGDNNSSSYNGLEPLDSATPFVFSNTNVPSDDSFFVSFATKADLTKASGVYSSSVSIKAVASIVPYIHDTIDDLHYMQDINDSVIESMVVNQQYKLYDQRDGKGYWVAKLGDGNVWMTQDLDFELTAGDRLFEGYSDIPRNRDNTIYASYFEIEGTTSKDIKEPWLSKNPEKRKYGQTYTAGIPISGTHSYRPASDPLLGTTVRCTIEDDYGEKTADVIVPNYNIDGKRLSYYTDSAACAAANETTVEECEHRLVGVYYNGIAMESSEFSSTNGYDRKTICPGRWTIPTSSELGNLMSQKAPDILLDAPYYFNYGGLYGYRNATITYSQWLSQPNVIVYNYKNHSDSYYFYTFPYGFNESYMYGDNVFTSTNYSYLTRNLEGQAAPLRCIARKGY